MTSIVEAALRVRLEEAERERDEARAELQKTRDDFSSVWNSRDEVIEERERSRQACNAYWHDLMRIASLCEQSADEYPLKAVERTIKQFQEVIKQRDEARHRARRACQVLVAEIGADGPADVDSVAERAAAEIRESRRDFVRVADALGLVSTDDTGRIGQVARVDEVVATARSIESLHAEVEVLRGVGCREAKDGEIESGPCGVCLRCAEERGERRAQAEVERLRRLLDHATQSNPGTSVLVMLMDEAAKLRERIASMQESMSMACEEPPTNCECAGCSYAREKGGDA
jgi:hypothetical protein